VTAPTTKAGRALVTATYGSRMRPREDYEALCSAIAAIEAEARAVARAEARRRASAVMFDCDVEPRVATAVLDAIEDES